MLLQNEVFRRLAEQARSGGIVDPAIARVLGPLATPEALTAISARSEAAVSAFEAAKPARVAASPWTAVGGIVTRLVGTYNPLAPSLTSFAQAQAQAQRSRFQAERSMANGFLPNGTSGGSTDVLGGQDWLSGLGRIAGEVLTGMTLGYSRGPSAQQIQQVGAALGLGGPMVNTTPGTVQLGFTPPTASGASLYRRTILHRISVRIGHRVTIRDVVRLVRQLGIPATAAGLGESEVDIGGLFFFGMTRHRRRRGISARDISRARSTIRRVSGFMHMLQRGLPVRRSFVRALPHRHRVRSLAA